MFHKLYFRLAAYLLLLVAGIATVHSWVTNPLFWSKIPYRLSAYELALTAVSCDRNSPAGLSRILQFHALPNFALNSEIVYVNQAGESFGCRVSTDGGSGSVYRFASMTKAITAHAVLKLADNGAFSLNDALLDFFPEVNSSNLRDDRLRQVTLSHLLNHSSGFGGPFGSDNMVKEGVTPWCPYEFSELSAVRLAGQPGTNHVYSNVAYCLLGEVVGRVVGIPYRQFISENYLSGTDIGFVDGGFMPDEPAYDFSNDLRLGRNYVDWLDFQALSSSAGLIGRPDEFAQMIWDKVHVDAPRLLNAPLVPGCGKRQIPRCYSWNFELELDEQGRVLAGTQQGYMPGASSMLAITTSGQVVVWVAAGAAIESRYKDDMKKAIVEFLGARKKAEHAAPNSV